MDRERAGGAACAGDVKLERRGGGSLGGRRTAGGPHLCIDVHGGTLIVPQPERGKRGRCKARVSGAGGEGQGDRFEFLGLRVVHGSDHDVLGDRGSVVESHRRAGRRVAGAGDRVIRRQQRSAAERECDRQRSRPGAAPDRDAERAIGGRFGATGERDHVHRGECSRGIGNCHCGGNGGTENVVGASGAEGEHHRFRSFAQGVVPGQDGDAGLCRARRDHNGARQRFVIGAMQRGDPWAGRAVHRIKHREWKGDVPGARHHKGAGVRHGARRGKIHFGGRRVRGHNRNHLQIVIDQTGRNRARSGFSQKAGSGRDRDFDCFQRLRSLVVYGLDRENGGGCARRNEQCAGQRFIVRSGGGGARDRIGDGEGGTGGASS